MILVEEQLALVSSPTSLVVDGLPAGVTGSFSAGVLTIQGTPTAPPLAPTTYIYSIVTSGNSGSCSETTVSGTITVAPVQSITPVSISSVQIQDVCNPSLAITPIIYNLSGASTISPSTASVTVALPSGINANPVVIRQKNTINVTGAATGTHSIAINGEVFTFGTGASSSAEDIRNGLRAAISGSSAIVNASNGGSTSELIIESKIAGIPFAVNFGGYSGVANLTNTITVANKNQIEITGTFAPSVTTGTYSFTLTTYAGASPSCVATSTIDGSITLKASSTLVLTSAAATASQTVCVNTAITSITYTYGGGATSAQVAGQTMVVDGLPTGVTPTVSNTLKTITLDGTPSVTTTYTTIYNYTVSSVGPSGCPEIVMYGSITVEPEELIELVSAGSSTNQTNICPGDTIIDIIYDIKGSALSISPALPLTLPQGITAVESKTQQSNRVNITGAVTGTYILGVNGSVVSYTYVTGNTTQTIRDALRSAINGDALISNVVLAADIGTDALSLTATVSGTPFSIQIGGTAGATNMSNAITVANKNQITIGGTVDVNAAPAVYSYTVSTTAGGACATPTSLSGTITIPSATVTLTSAAPTESQSVCVNTAITPITYSVVGASGASVVPPTSLVVDGLPAGVTGNYAANVYTITGIPTVAVLTETLFTYTINSTGASCAEGTVSGTITVAPVQSITPVSISSVQIQDVCNPSLAITPIIYNLSGASTISPSTASVTVALPSGINANPVVIRQKNTINVTGAATGTHSIAINGEVFTFGTGASSSAEDIRNGLRAAISGSSAIVNASNGGSTSELIIESKIAGIPFAVNFGGYSGVANLTNTITVANKNQIEITGTFDPSVTTGTYSFTLTTYAGASPSCVATSTIDGSITLKASSTLVLTSAAPTASQTVCVNTAITSITYTYGGGATSAQVAGQTMVVDGLPTGVTPTVSNTLKTITLDGTPSVTTTYTTIYNYTVSSVGPSGCPEIVMYGSITVEPEELIELVSAGSSTNQNVCAGDTLIAHHL